MSLYTKIRKSGASAILTIPKPVMDYLNAEIGTTISVDMVDGLMVCKKKVDDTMTLESLIAGSPIDRLALTKEDKEWLHARSVGEEI